MKRKFSSKNFDNYQEMEKSAKNWNLHCSYRLQPSAFLGENHVIELPHIQLSYTYREGGFMHDAISPPDTVSIALIQECHDVACFDTFKLHKGMVLFFDDTKALNFMSKGAIRVAIISIPISMFKAYDLNFEAYISHYIQVSDNTLETLFEKVLSHYLKEEVLEPKVTEDAFIVQLKKMMQTTSINKIKLTRGETIALKIRDRVYRHMDGKIHIEMFAQEYGVSDQTLQNAFKSLFGFTPKKFLQLLKLNLVHRDLLESEFKTSSVQAIASKWGFVHLGRFAQAYAALFEEKPSQTLKTEPSINKNIKNGCVERQEEMV